jgi:AAA+ superfamily predicted ATPase
MTKLITATFAGVAAAAAKWKGPDSKARAGGILFIDEADALAQSRETSEMHHEDRAGVNALIRGIDDVTRAQLPVAVLMATNRLPSIDPAIRRRAADILEFGRPADEQRQHILSEALGHALSVTDIQQLVRSTGPTTSGVGFTYSDLTQRLLPMVLLAAIPNTPVTFDLVKRVLKDVHATPTFRDAGS